jgi:hypothetical protein
MLVCKRKEGEFLSENQSIVNVYLNKGSKHTTMQNIVIKIFHQCSMESQYSDWLRAG